MKNILNNVAVTVKAKTGDLRDVLGETLEDAKEAVENKVSETLYGQGYADGIQKAAQLVRKEALENDERGFEKSAAVLHILAGKIERELEADGS